MRMLLDPKSVNYNVNTAPAVDIDFSCPENRSCNPGCYSCTPTQAQD